jgi:hypothetical protein
MTKLREDLTVKDVWVLTTDAIPEGYKPLNIVVATWRLDPVALMIDAIRGDETDRLEHFSNIYVDESHTQGLDDELFWNIWNRLILGLQRQTLEMGGVGTVGLRLVIAPGMYVDSVPAYQNGQQLIMYAYGTAVTVDLK